MPNHHLRAGERLGLGVLVCVHIALCCVSLVYVANFRLDAAEFHIFYIPAELHIAVLAVGAFAIVAPLFAFARFSFGYFVGFHFYTMVLSYLWLNCFTDLNYDHRLAGLSAAVSVIAFLLPALFISAPLRQVYVLSTTGFDRLLSFIVLLAVALAAVGATYNFQIVAVEDIYDFRNKTEFPTILKYLIGTTCSSLLPFAFAGFATRRAYWRASAVLLLLLLFYPITLSKLALFTPFWLVFILLLAKLAEARTAVVLSLLLPILAGVLLVGLFGERGARIYFAAVNYREVAIPATALNVYNDFFSRHDLTYFCQISVLKRVMHCPYQVPLSVVMQETYKLGNFNASLFATEGIASVGGLLAPVSVFLCGLLIALGNRLSAGLPAGFVLISAAILPRVLLDVPLTTVLLTHGAGLLFLLWYVTPRTLFEPGAAAQTDIAGRA